MGNSSSTILTKEQREFLKLFEREWTLARRFYLTGGTALAEFYLHHRHSEDLDLFSEHEFDLLPIRAWLKKIQKPLGLKKIDYQNFLGLHTFFLSFHNGETLKVDFNYYPFPRIEPPPKHIGLAIDSVYDIAVNKVHTIAMQPRARDFIDVYFIIRKYDFTFPQLLKDAKVKFDWHIDAAQLGAGLLHALDVKDFPRMIVKINHLTWQNFFVAEAKKLGVQILKP